MRAGGYVRQAARRPPVDPRYGPVGGSLSGYGRIGQAKIFTAEAAIEITNEALQLHGASGYGRDLPIERMARDARMFTIGAARLRFCATWWRAAF